MTTLTTSTSSEKKIWQFYSYLFHPIFIPVYITCFLLYYNNDLFIKNTGVAQNSLLINVIINLVMFQAITMFLLKQLKFIDSVYLNTQKERIVPLFVYTIFTFWVWAFVLMKNPANYPSVTVSSKVAKELLEHPVRYPKIAINMGLAFFVASSLALLINSFYKISLHMIGAGLLVAITIVTTVKLDTSYLFIVFSGLIATTIFLSRKNVSNHSIFEMYSGFMLGLLTMLIAQFVF